MSSTSYLEHLLALINEMRFKDAYEYLREKIDSMKHKDVYVFSDYVDLRLDDMTNMKDKYCLSTLFNMIPFIDTQGRDIEWEDLVKNAPLPIPIVKINNVPFDDLIDQIIDNIIHFDDNEDYFDELFTFIETYRDIIEQMGTNNFITTLKDIFLDLYEEGVDNVEFQYERFFNERIPNDNPMILPLDESTLIHTAPAA